MPNSLEFQRNLFDPLPAKVRIVQRAQKLKQVVVWVGVTSTGKTPLFFVPEGTKVDGPAYREMLRTKVLPGLFVLLVVVNGPFIRMELLRIGQSKLSNGFEVTFRTRSV